MTLLNTISNFGYKWSATLMLWLVEFITWKSCVVEHTNDTNISSNNTCSNKDQQENCKQLGGSCQMEIDGYYIECTLCIIYGILWYFWGKKKIRAVQNIPLESWQVNYKKTFYDWLYKIWIIKIYRSNYDYNVTLKFSFSINCFKIRLCFTFKHESLFWFTQKLNVRDTFYFENSKVLIIITTFRNNMFCKVNW